MNIRIPTTPSISWCALITRESRNLCVVGDDDQSIYGWRGADIRNILDFEKDFPDATVIKLEQNYRSTANILDAANQIIAHNEGRKEKELWTEDGDGRKRLPCTPRRTSATRRPGSASASASCSAAARPTAASPSCTVCTPSAAYWKKRSCARAFPIMCTAARDFYDRREVRDVLAYLRVIQNPADDISLSRIINVPKRAIGDSTVEQLTQYARQNDMSLYAAVAAPPDTLASRARKSVNDFSSLIVSLLLAKETLPLSEFVQKVIDDSGLIAQYQKEENEENQARIENMREFMGAVTEFEQKSEDKSLFAFLENVALVTEA